MQKKEPKEPELFFGQEMTEESKKIYETRVNSYIAGGSNAL